MNKQANDGSRQYATQHPTPITTPSNPIITSPEPTAAGDPRVDSPKSRKKDANLWCSRYNHPYETEIQRMQYPERVFQQSDPVKYSPIGETSAIWVDTYEGVLEMLEELKKAGEIAIDLEHHDYRTYIGLTCLMQISTRDKDWIVDTLKPWRHRLQVLNEVFADPSIVKVCWAVPGCCRMLIDAGASRRAHGRDLAPAGSWPLPQRLL